MTCDKQQQVTSIPSLPLCSVKPSEDYSLAPSVFHCLLRCMVFDICRMLTHGERRNDFAVWTVRTLPGSTVKPLSQFSAVLNNHVTGTALPCRTVCEGPSPFGRKTTTGLTFTGQTDRLRDVRSLCVRVLTKTDKRPSQHARTADGGARYIVRATVVQWHRSTALECGLWCAWFVFLHIISHYMASHNT